MRLDVRHRTHYRYANPAAFSQHLLRLSPVTVPGQRVILSSVNILPEPEAIDTHEDMFGNRVHVATISRPHDELEIIATSRIDRAERTALIFEASVPWEATRAAALGLAEATPVAELSPYAFPSAMSAPDVAIEAYVAETFEPGRPILAGAQELMSRIYNDFEYDTDATGAETLASESFQLKRGVCQDFAHVMLAALRSLRIPARYISGYLRTVPPEGQERLQGADASHAWVSVWDPAFGWVDFDPTNDCVPGVDHVTLASGRDYSDVAPVSGIVVGAGRQLLSVGVDVVAAPESEPPVLPGTATIRQIQQQMQ
ncbi:MAG: transglutaminase family protein [Pseudomonadota bacterium]